MIKKPEDNIDASHRLSIDNFTIITKFKVRNGYGRHSRMVMGGGEIHSNDHNLPRHCTSTESPPVTMNHFVNTYSENAKSCKALVSMYINKFRGCQKLILFTFP